LKQLTIKSCMKTVAFFHLGVQTVAVEHCAEIAL